MANSVSQVTIESRIHLIRGKKVMFDRDLAALYEVQAKALNQAVKRNIGRFPEDFMFQLSKDEAEASRSQFVTLKRGQNIKYLPYAFTEQGVAMLSSVLNSERAILVNIQIIRAFVRMRNLITENKDLLKMVQHIERRLDVHDQQIQVAFAALKNFLQPKPAPQIEPRKHYSPDEEKKMGFGKARKNQFGATNFRRLQNVTGSRH